MLDEVDLSLALPKRAAKQAIAAQMDRLYELQRTVFDRKLPVVILFEGWDAAGKGTVIRALTERLDPRGFKVLSTQAPRTHEQQKPWLWRFWMEIPRRGQIAIFDRSWYGRVVIERVEGLTPIPDWIRAYEEINGFERTLADDGTIFCKFWLHIDRAEQLRRFILLTEDPATAWQVTAEDWARHQKYDEYAAALLTCWPAPAPTSPWDVVPSTDINYKTWHVFATIIRRLETALGEAPASLPTYAELAAPGKGEKTSKKRRKRAQTAAKGSETGDDRDDDAAETAAAHEAKGVKPKAEKSPKTPKSKKKREQRAAKTEPAPAADPASKGDVEARIMLEETDA
ncbi:MAG: hypothetical protein R2851_19310 [Caldilineaceae bacterium]